MKNVGKILSSAVKWWLSTQVEKIERLDIEIDGGSRQILGGYLPHIVVQAQEAVYQGIHLKDAHLSAENIRINIGQILRGKPFHLLAPVPVTGKIILTQEDLQSSLASELLCSGLNDLLIQLIPKMEEYLKSYTPVWQTIQLAVGKFTINGFLEDPERTPIEIQSGLKLVNSHTLSLHPLCLKGLRPMPNFTIEDFSVDLGKEVNIQELIVSEEHIVCHGGLTIMP